MANMEEANDGPRGPIKNRSCTDVLCLLLFVAFLVGWGVVGYFGFTLGNPEKLIHPTDSDGRICGFHDSVKDKPFLFFFDLTKCASPIVLTTGCPTPQVCVQKCPDETFWFSSARAQPDKVKKLICKENVTADASNADRLVSSGLCAQWYIASTSALGRCIPGLQTNNSEVPIFPNKDLLVKDVVNGTESMAKLNNLRELAERVFQDFTKCWPMVLIGLAAAMLVSLVWILMMRFIAGFMVWLSILAVLALQAVGIWFCYTKYVELKEKESAPLSLVEVFTTSLHSYLELRETWLVFLVTLAILTAITLLILIFLRSRIRIAIALISYGSKAVGHIMSTLVFPIFPWILQVGVIGYYVAVAAYLASAGKSSFRITGLVNRTDGCECPLLKEGFFCTPDTFNELCKCPNATCQFFSYDPNSVNNYLQFYNLFGLFWGLFFASALGEMVLAGAFATWYWSFEKPRDVPFYAVTHSFFRTIRYHLGTLAFGSLIISFIRAIRVLLEYIDRKVREYQDNCCSRFLLCCCKCFFWCLEKFMRFVNRNAYIMCAVYGSNFCVSAKEAFSLLIRNAARVFVLDTVTEFLLFLGRMVIVCAVGIGSFYVFTDKSDVFGIPELNFYFGPIIVIVLGTWFITSIFFSVYSMAIDTIFLCFLQDCELNDGSPDKPYFMSKELMSILGKKNKA